MSKRKVTPVPGKVLRSLSIALLIAVCHPSAVAQLALNDTFGDLSECDTMTRSIYVVWWDKDFDYEDEVSELLDTMISYRQTCLNDMDMQDPPNPPDGFYYNVYIHQSGYFSVYNWGNGQGTDANGYPFLTLPGGLINDWPNTAHETFHIFQYSATAPGFAYSGDSQWYIEASANWFAARQNPDSPRRFVEAESLVRVPQVPYWLSFDNFPNDYPPNWQRYVHQYALALHLYYLTDVAGVPESIITSGLYSNTTEMPQEYLYHTIGADTFRQHFIDWAAHMINDFDFIPAYQSATNLNEWNTYADPDDDHRIIATYSNEGTGGWVVPDNDQVTHAWSFNTYKLENNETATYSFELSGHPVGNYGDPSQFKGKVLVRNSVVGSSFYDLDMTNTLEGSFTLEVTPEDSEIYFIIAAVPEVFQDNNPAFQRFPYEMRIVREEVNNVSESGNSSAKSEIGRYNLLGQPISRTAGGMQVILYRDGTSQLIFRSRE